MLTKKTSVLVAAAAQCAGKIKGVGSDEEALLWQYGLSLGLAYQLCDDVVSIWGSSDMTGKQAHGDVREKKKTLPVLYAKEQLDTKERAELISLYNASQSLDEITVMRIIELLNSVEAYAYARKRITQYRNEACEVANRLSISDEHKNTLIALVDALLPEVEM